MDSYVQEEIVFIPPVFQLLKKIIYSCYWVSGSVGLALWLYWTLCSDLQFSSYVDFFFLIMLPLNLALSLIWIRFNMKLSEEEGTSVWLNHFKYFSKIQRKSLLGTFDVLFSTDPEFLQFRGACGALKWVQLWQTGGAQGLCQITLFCVLQVSGEREVITAVLWSRDIHDQ